MKPVASIIGGALLAIHLILPAAAEPIYALQEGSTQRLLRFDSATPGTLTLDVAITGLEAFDSLGGIDFRPASGTLYGYSDGNQHLYTIDPATGAATRVATATEPLFGQGVDFDPVADRLRTVHQIDQNGSIDPVTGAATFDAGLAYAPGDVNEGRNPSVAGIAYGNNVAGAVASMLYGIDFDQDVLVRIDVPSAGSLLTVGSLGLTLVGFVGFDISGQTGIAYAALDPLTTAFSGSGLYTIDLTTGAATLVGAIGPGTLEVIGIAAPIGTVREPGSPVPEPATHLLAVAALALAARRARRGSA